MAADDPLVAVKGARVSIVDASSPYHGLSGIVTKPGRRSVQVRFDGGGLGGAPRIVRLSSIRVRCRLPQPAAPPLTVQRRPPPRRAGGFRRPVARGAAARCSAAAALATAASAVAAASGAITTRQLAETRRAASGHLPGWGRPWRAAAGARTIAAVPTTSHNPKNIPSVPRPGHLSCH